MQLNLKMNAQLCMYSQSELNVGHCSELTFLEGKLGRFYYDNVLKWSFFNLLHFESEGESSSLPYFKTLITRNLPTLPSKKDTSIQWPMLFDNINGIHCITFSVLHLLWQGASVYNGHLRGPVTLTPVAKRLAVELFLSVFTTYKCLSRLKKKTLG